MNTRLYNARILSMNDGCELSDGEIWIEGNKISYVGAAGGDETSKKEIRFDIEKDCHGNVLMPGFNVCF